MHKEIEQNKSWDFLHFSPSRGNLPVLYSGVLDELGSVDILTNGGAQLMNSEIYARRYRDSYARRIVELNEWSVAGNMLAYSRPEDRFIFTSDDANEAIKIFSTIADSYDEIEIPVSHNFVPVMILDNHTTDRPLLPNVLSKEVVRLFSDPSLAEPNVRYYRKDQHQQLWQKSGLPTPRTLYLRHGVNGNLSESIASIGGHNKYVVNTLDGSGGHNIIFTSYNELSKNLAKLHSNPDDDLVQIQGALPLISSPCVIANLSDHESTIVMASYQRFKKEGVYGGNKWTNRTISEIQNYEHIYMAAFENLRNVGVRGQVNIDLLFIDPLFAQYNDISPVILREANIRPAGSSVLLRLQEAKIHGKPVERIHLANGIAIGNIEDVLFINSSYTDMYAHVYNYINKRASIAFMAADGISEQTLTEFEEEVRLKLA